MRMAHATEASMLASVALEPIMLPARSVRRIEDGRGMQVSCVRGTIWVTQTRDPRDIILASGQSLVLDRRGLAVVYAFRDAVITVGPAWQLPASDPMPRAACVEPACA
jgi:hypothetical protein